MCPECGIPKDAYGNPRCDCALRAADSLQETRQAEAAAAEDFDPLRIRPYVALPDDDSDEQPGEPATTRLPVAYRPAGPPAVRAEPLQTDVELFVPESGAGGGEVGGRDRDWEVAVPDVSPQPGPRRRRRTRRNRRRGAVLAVCGAVLAVVAVATAAAFMSSDDPEDNQALPDSGSSSSPAKSVAPTSEAPSKSASASASASPSASPSASASVSKKPSASASASKKPSASTKASTPATSAPPETPAGPRVLQEGDSGDDVRDMQRRLQDVSLYRGPAHGKFDDDTREAVADFQFWYGIDEDPRGVYGAATRERLEERTG